MALTHTAPIDRAIVRRVRGSSPITGPLRGGIHEAVASRAVPYPFLTYALVSAPIITDHGTSEGTTREIRSLYDILISATNQVVAKNLDQLVDELFSGKIPEFNSHLEGQTCYYLERIRNAGVGPDKDDEGRYYVQTGGTYEIWTTQRVLYSS